MSSTEFLSRLVADHELFARLLPDFGVGALADPYGYIWGGQPSSNTATGRATIGFDVRDIWKSTPISADYCTTIGRRSGSSAVAVWDLASPAHSTGALYQIASVTMSTKAGIGGTITTTWSNVGTDVTHDAWSPVLRLTSCCGRSFDVELGMRLDQLLPGTGTTTWAPMPTDVVAGEYRVEIIVVDVDGQMRPLVLANSGRTRHGGYALGSITIIDGMGESTSVPTTSMQAPVETTALRIPAVLQGPPRMTPRTLKAGGA